MFVLLSLLRLMKGSLNRIMSVGERREKTNCTASKQSPWDSVVVISVGIVFLAGPVVWVVRDRYSEQRRERLKLLAFGIAMIVFPLTLGLSLALGISPFISSSDALIVGCYVGIFITLIAEQTVVSERLRAVN